jgi:hypothetical protein
LSGLLGPGLGRREGAPHQGLGESGSAPI